MALDSFWDVGHWEPPDIGHSPYPEDTGVIPDYCCDKEGGWTVYINPDEIGHLIWNPAYHCVPCVPPGTGQGATDACRNSSTQIMDDDGYPVGEFYGPADNPWVDANGNPQPCVDKATCEAYCIGPDDPTAGDRTKAGFGSTPEGGWGTTVTGGSYGWIPGGDDCVLFDCCKAGASMSNGDTGFGTYRSDDPGDLHGDGIQTLQKRFMIALGVKEVGRPVMGKSRGDWNQAPFAGGAAGTDPGRNVGTAHGCLQIRQPYWQDAQEQYAKMQFAHHDINAYNSNNTNYRRVKGGPPSCPRRYDFKNYEGSVHEKNGRPEGFAFLEAYEIVCNKYFLGNGMGYTTPQRGFRSGSGGPGFYRWPGDGGDNPVSRPGWYCHPDSNQKGGLNVVNFASGHAVIPAGGYPTITPAQEALGMDTDSWNQCPQAWCSPCVFVPKTWDIDCACDYSKWVASMYFRRYLHSKWWGPAKDFSPVSLGRLHRLGPNYRSRAYGARQDPTQLEYDALLKGFWIEESVKEGVSPQNAAAQFENNNTMGW